MKICSKHNSLNTFKKMFDQLGVKYRVIPPNYYESVDTRDLLGFHRLVVDDMWTISFNDLGQYINLVEKVYDY